MVRRRARRRENLRAPIPKVFFIPSRHQAILLRKAIKEHWGMIRGCSKVKTPQVDNEASSMAKVNYA